jgi:1A family penicillin-binding protein
MRGWAFLLPSRRFVVTIIVIGVLLGGGAVAWVAKDAPDPRNLYERHIVESTKIYDRTGTVLLYEIGDVRRTRVPLNEISPFARDATIAIEDRNFYRHRGLNFRGILRALFANVRGKSLQGGSSITQQLVKNAILTPERTLTRKIREAILAMELERRFSKDQILEMYLNEIPYGTNAYGVEAAARTYFGTSAKDLSLTQAALLSALPKAPTYYSPYGSRTDELFARQHSILDTMAREGHITKAQAEEAKQVQLTFTKRRDAITAPHFVFYVREQLENEYGETIVTQGGLKVITTLDASMQKAAEEAVTTQAPKNLKYNAHNAALVAINPKDGDILAMVGSVDYFDTDNDGNVNVAIRIRSPGSSFKPIVYAHAFRKGYTPDTMLADVPIEFGTGEKSYRPGNFDLKTNGPVTMRQALARSLNIPAVQTLYLAGLHETLALAREMGFTTLTDPDRYGLSLVLGGGEVRLLDEVSAYGVFSTEGVRYPHRAVLRVEDPTGRVLQDATKEPPEGKQVLEPEIAQRVTDILSDNGARAPTFGAASSLQLGERPVAAKTGTAQEFRDGWTIGYTPSIAAGVWVGNNDNTPMSREPGVYTAAPIWNAFMRKVLSGTPIERFTKPQKITTGKGALDGRLPEATMKYDKDTNTILPADCPVPVGTPKKFVEFHSILYYVRKDDPRGGDQEDVGSDPMFARWESGVAAWRNKWNTEHPDDEKRYVDKLPEVSCDPSLLEGRPEIVFRSPVDEVIRTSPVRVAADISAPSRIVKVEFFAGGEKIGERTEEPWEALYVFSPNTSGRVTLRIRAETEEKKVNEVSKSILVNPDEDVPKVNLVQPRPGETIPPSKFPSPVKVDASDHRGIALVDVLYRPEGEQRTSRVGRTDKPVTAGGKRYEILWQTSPAPGTYTLWVVATDTTGNRASTPPITITIP